MTCDTRFVTRPVHLHCRFRWPWRHIGRMCLRVPHDIWRNVSCCSIRALSTCQEADSQAWPSFIESGNQQSYPEWPRHDTLLPFRTLPEPQRQVTDRLRTAFRPELLPVMECMVLALDSGVLDHAAGIGLQSAHGASDVAVDLDNLFHGRGLEERARDALLDAEDDAGGCGDLDRSGEKGCLLVGRARAYAYCGGAKLDSF
jgi:hypothetical protein